ncbi:MAG: hypothetical protein COA78_23950 [Blastopirellula sp.]|nr:MAG: hypothetical protein COA78_23950 [Blastopirellula sp.]
MNQAETTSTPPELQQTETSLLRHKLLYLALAITIIVRIAVSAVSLSKLEDDPDSYRLLATNLIHKQSFTLDDPAEPTAFRPVLYPLLLAATSRSGSVLPAEVAALHLVLGALTVAGVYAWVFHLGYRKQAFAAAVLVGIDPVLLNQSTLVMSETFAVFLTVLVLITITALHQTLIATSTEEKDSTTKNQSASKNDLPIRAMNVAGALMLAFYCRPSFLIWWALILLAFVVVRGVDWKKRMLAVFSICLVSIFMLLPWVARNYLVFDAPVIATTHGGVTLLLGNNPEFYEYLQNGDSPVWDSTSFHERLDDDYPAAFSSQGELARDKELSDEAVENIQASPGMFAYSSLIRFGRLWRPMPHQLSEQESIQRTSARYLVGIWYTLQFIFAAIGLWQLRSKLLSSPWLMIVLLPISLSLVHSVFWSNIRMRAPVVPVIALLAVLGATHLWQKYVRKQRPSVATSTESQ